MTYTDKARSVDVVRRETYHAVVVTWQTGVKQVLDFGSALSCEALRDEWADYLGLEKTPPAGNGGQGEPGPAFADCRP